MKNKTNSNPKGKADFKKTQKKTQFKSSHSNSNKSKNNKKGDKPGRNQYTFAEEKRLQRIREQNERKADKEAKILLAKKDKKRKLKILSKKNTKGQPIMGGRMELLLEKIQKRAGQS